MQYGKCFFEYVYVKSEGDSFCISCKSDVFSQKEEYAKEYAKKVVSELSEEGRKFKINLKCEIPENIISAAGGLYKEDEEANPDDMEQYYTKENQEKYGVIAIEIKKV